MTTISVTVNKSDLHALERKLAAAGNDVLPKIVEAAAAYAQQQARAGAPRQTGALASSIVVEGRGLEARVHSPLAYALPEEFGRHARGGRGMKGRFFLKRAVDMLRNSELPRILKKAADELESAWGRR